MRFGLLLPCKVTIIHDPTFYSVRLPGESEIDVLLPSCEHEGPMEPITHNRIWARIQSSKQQLIWLPQPQNDLGFFRSLREGGAYLGDIRLNGEFVSEYVLDRGFADKRGKAPEWLADEWIRLWSL